MKIKFAKSFTKKQEKVDKKNKDALAERLSLFQLDSFHPQLNNHQLTGKYIGCRSINITGDWRAIFREYYDENGNLIIVFLFLGTHSQLYK